MKLFLTIALLFITSNAFSATIYVNPDGGTGTQCTGLTDAALSGATGTACRLNHPNWVFPPRGESTTRAAVAGDTVVIEYGSYRIGCQNASTCKDANVNLTQNGFCNPSWSYDCYMNTVPNNVTVVGCTASGCGVNPKPELWGAGKVTRIIGINSASGITLKDLEITDHATAGYAHPTLSTGCSGSPASSLTAFDGIDQTNSNNITYQGVNVHGVCRYGAYGGSVGNHTYTDSSFSFNSYGGINYDSCNNDGTCGVSIGNTMTFLRTFIDWNGCVESSSSIGTPATSGCYDQNNSGYGDGIGLTNTSGTWTFTSGGASHNASDGLDWLYGNRTGKTGFNVTIKRSLFEGNVGQAFKTDNNLTAEDNYIIGNCQYFHGKSFSYGGITDCRGGATITIASNTNSGNTTAKLYNNTITSNFDVMLLAGASGSCSGNTFNIDARNNILMGGADYNGGDATSIYYSDCGGSGSSTFTEDYNSCTNTFKEASPCPASHSKNNVTTAATFAGTIKQGTVGSTDLTTYYGDSNYVAELTLNPSSSAVGSALTTISGTDSYGYGLQDRGAIWDIGALDYSSGVSAVCGDGVTATPEACDDGNTTASDGCSATCTIETGYGCSGTPSVCSTTCGDGIKAGSEGCDDSNTTSGDGCSNTCTVESGWNCTGTAPSVCTGSAGTGHPGVVSGKVNFIGGCTIR